MARTLVLDTITDPDNSTGNANITLSPDSTTTLPKVDINSGAIDNTTLGAATPSSVAATTLSASGNATVGGTLGVTGVTTLSGNATVGGTLGVTGASTLTGNTTVGGTLGVTGATTVAALTATTVNSASIASSADGYSHFIGANLPSASASAHNTGMGGYVMNALTSGKWNTCIGYGAGRYITEGLSNVIVGAYAGDAITDGDYNTCVGREAGTKITTGINNTAIGNSAMDDNLTGSNNICIGNYAGSGGGPGGSVTGSNIIVIGDGNITDFYCADDSISTSDGRDKTDVEDFTAGLTWIEAMRPVTFHWDKRNWYAERDEEGNIISTSEPNGTHKKDRKNLGFIGQEVLAIEQAHGFANDKNDMLTVNLTPDDTAYGMKYSRLIPVLVNAIKELSAKVKALESA
tara:strand:+ start:60 stop:1274 length:1215 start_codon:yes stop_codon:yes gene_type:complete